MTKVMTARPTMAVRRGLRLIVDKVTEDFDNAFERLFPDIDERQIMLIMAALEWLEQYALEDTDL